MSLPTLIDVAIGLVLVFFLLATLGSLLAEFWTAHQKVRHQLLRETITRLLEPGTDTKFWTHSLIQPLSGRTPRSASGKTRAASAHVESVKAAPTTRRGKLASVLGRPVRLIKRGLASFSPREAEAPAYLNSNVFAATVLDIASGQGAAGRLPQTVGAWASVIKAYVPAKPGEHNDLQDRLLAILRMIPPETPDVFGALKTAVARWYEEAMQRASSVYRRKTQMTLFIAGSSLALVLNADALRIAQILYENPALSREIAQQAEQIHAQLADSEGKLKPTEPGQGFREQIKAPTGNLRDMVKVGFPLGWMPNWRDNFIYLSDLPVETEATVPPAAVPPKGDLLDRLAHSIASARRSVAQRWNKITSPGPSALLAKFCGLTISTFAVCLGAPFWFDLLGRLVKMRSSAGADAEKKKKDDGGAASAPADAPGSTPPSTPAAAPGTAAALPLPSALDALSQPGTAFDVARTYWLAEFADRAYETDATLLTHWLAENGFAIAKSFDAMGTQGFLATSRSGVAVLVFRGTEKKLADWVTDAKFGLVEGKNSGVPGRIHVGFAEALKLIAHDLDASFDELANKRVLLHVTGHGLGAALATVAAMRCAGRATTRELVHTVHTYGSPRVGDPDFVAAYERKFHGRAYRVVNNEDLVTRVPPRIFPVAEGTLHYEHVGEMIFIDDAGSIQRDAGYWFRFLNFVTHALDDLKNAVKTTVKDHSMQFYCGYLKRAAQAPRSNT